MNDHPNVTLVPPEDPPGDHDAAVGRPTLWPPRGSNSFGDYTLRDFAAKFLVQQDDFAEIERYRDANRQELAGDPRPSVVLMGDSITDFWPLETLRAAIGLRLINRAIAGQNSSVMLLRFQPDVIELAPRAVVLLAGTNDLRVYAGAPDALTNAALERLSRNLTAMADMAEGRGVGVVLATLPPVGGDLMSVARSPAGVCAVNAWIAGFAARRGYALADYHNALVGLDGLLPQDLSDDGVHPNAAGYRRMEPVLLNALAASGLLIPLTDPQS